MKLRNKKTGEIVETDFELSVSVPDDEKLYGNDTYTQINGYSSIKDLIEEWEDYEEPKEFYIVENRGIVGSRFRTSTDYEEKFKEIGNYFETKEEAEKAVEKLKAWKRLSENKYLFSRLRSLVYSLNGNSREFDEYMDDILLLFGGEE